MHQLYLCSGNLEDTLRRAMYASSIRESAGDDRILLNIHRACFRISCEMCGLPVSRRMKYRGVQNGKLKTLLEYCCWTFSRLSAWRKPHMPAPWRAVDFTIDSNSFFERCKSNCFVLLSTERTAACADKPFVVNSEAARSYLPFHLNGTPKYV